MANPELKISNALSAVNDQTLFPICGAEPQSVLLPKGKPRFRFGQIEPVLGISLPTLAPRTSAAGTIRLRTGLTDGQRSAFNVLAVEGGNGFQGFAVVTHVNEPKPFGSSRTTVSHNPDSLNCSVSFKKRIENRFRDRNIQVANKYAFHMLKVFNVVVNPTPTLP